MKERIDQVQTQIKYYREKSDNYKEACEWLQKKLIDAEEIITEKEKMINTFENIEASCNQLRISNAETVRKLR